MKTKLIDYEVIASGSSGNCVRIGPVLIDCGIPYYQLDRAVAKAKVILITHQHGDHLKPATLKHAHTLLPGLAIYSTPDVAKQYDYVKPAPTVESGKHIKVMYQGDTLTIQAFPCLHDVDCYGYLISWNGCHIIYATDTAFITNPIPNRKYDLIMLESNYDPVVLRQASIKEPIRAKRNLRHLSTPACKAFYFCNRAPNGILEELHKSTRYYTGH